MDLDYYSVDSETIETLNILRPPVKRGHRNTKRDLFYAIGDSDKIDIVKDYTIYKTEKKEISKQIRNDVEPSSSLILQKTCKREVIEKYSLLNKTKKHVKKIHSDINICVAEEKPLIRVSVIPKRGQKQTLLGINNKNTKTTQHLTSKNENSIETKNLYLVSAGKKDKIYSIKSCGSTKTLKDQKEGSVKELYDNKHNYKLSNMEKKKKKSIKKKNQDMEYPNFSVMPCLCKYPTHNLVQDINSGSSKVKIFGRIGLNEDDRYVMNCAATVNGVPVATNYMAEETNEFNNSFVHGNRHIIEKETQATQVDFKVKVPNLSLTCDKHIQCNAYDVCVENNYGERSKINDLKARTSPLVIISVYPKHESPELSHTKNYGAYQPVQEDFSKLNEASAQNRDIYNARSFSPKRINIQNSKNIQTNKNYETRKKTASTNATLHNFRRKSPIGKPLQNYEPQKTKKNCNKRNTEIRERSPIQNPFRASRSVSPTRLPRPMTSKRDKQVNTQEDNDIVVAKSKIPRNLTTIKKPTDFVNLSNENNSNKNKSIKIRKQQRSRSPSGSRYAAHDKSVNTDGGKSKSLNEPYNKKLTTNKTTMNNKNTVIGSSKMKDKPMSYQTAVQNNISKVSVNIDSEKEFYDVIFERGNFKTDLIVRQTIKQNNSQMYFEHQFDNDGDDHDEHNRKSDSLENYFPLEGVGRHRRSVSQAFNNLPGDEMPLTQGPSRLNVCDSLEINHRKDGHKRIFENYNTDDNDKDVHGPIKHFTGDNCTISDPIERDKEIRELLGVKNVRTDYDHVAAAKNDVGCSRLARISSSCFFQRTLCESLATNVSFQNRCSCVTCSDIKMGLAVECISKTHKIWTENDPAEINELSILNSEPHTKYNELTEMNDIIALRKDENGNSTNEILRNRTTEILERSPKNHNIQDFLTLEICSRRKPILLSIKQYTKVKKTIKTLSDKRNKRTPNWNSSIVSVGDVKAKPKSLYVMHWNKEVQTDTVTDIKICDSIAKPKVKELKEAGDSHNNNLVLFTELNEVHNKKDNKEVRKVTSSVEIKYTSIAYMQEATCSFTNIGSLESSKIHRDRQHSIETIFRGHRKSRTPNLGASALSLLTEEGKSISKSEKSLSPDTKTKKPFLKRLMSCLVMRAGRSLVKIGSTPKLEQPAMNSSYDSYHICTSLGAFEMSSSLYDTSMSFYSNHTLGPVHNKIKRGFFSSVRELLTTRKS